MSVGYGVYLLQYYIYIICTAGWESNPCGDIKEIIYFSVRHTNVLSTCFKYINNSCDWETWKLNITPCVTCELWYGICKYFSSYHLPDGSTACFCKFKHSFYDNSPHLECNFFCPWNMDEVLCTVCSIKLLANQTILNMNIHQDKC